MESLQRAIFLSKTTPPAPLMPRRAELNELRARNAGLERQVEALCIDKAILARRIVELKKKLGIATGAKGPPIWRIIEACAAEFGIPASEILSHRRSTAIVFPRHVAMYLAKILTNQTFPQIGRAMGLDHSSIMHGMRKIGKLRETDDSLDQTLKRIEGALAEVMTEPAL